MRDKHGHGYTEGFIKPSQFPASILPLPLTSSAKVCSSQLKYIHLLQPASGQNRLIKIQHALIIILKHSVGVLINYHFHIQRSIPAFYSVKKGNNFFFPSHVG